MFVILSHVQQL